MELSQLNKGSLVLFARKRENIHAIILDSKKPTDKKRHLNVMFENKELKAIAWITAFNEIVIRIIFDNHTDNIFKIKSIIQS